MAGVPTGAIDALLHPPINLLSFYPDAGNPYTGDAWFEVPHTEAFISYYFGVVIEVDDIPAGLGFEIGFNGGPLDLSFDRYIDWFWQATQVLRTADGSQFGGDTQYGNYARQFIEFDRAFTHALALHTKPGIPVSLFWLGV